VADARRRPALVTTSWDDGDPLDLRLAEQLADRGLVGTFYVPIERGDQPVIGSREMRDLVDMGMEIGAHTYSHVTATSIPVAELERELTESKDVLEQSLGHRVRAFCYPNGRFTRSLGEIVANAGYDLGRTTVSCRVDTAFDPMFMPVTCQLYRHGRRQFVTHALRTRNVRGAGCWLSTLHAERGAVELTRRAARHVARHGGVVHVWGHSWELEHSGLWGMLDEVARVLEEFPELTGATNSGVLDACRAAG